MTHILDYTILSEKAIEKFWTDYNCAQSVLFAYSDYLPIDTNTSLSVSCGFGGGMGRLQETCGAVSAAYMVFGLLSESATNDNREHIEDTYSMIQKFHNLFIQNQGTSNCKELLNCDLNTEEGQNYFKSNNLKKTICESCIKASIKLIHQVITERDNAPH
ncbi:C-GCAxxG-C-C family protein [Plebeiibacterium sediminum]|uniref:C-GCAxxG-C-C family protein n=1 Tax=Plebeiibacterium sediminum TaxID=2992112 RepID=A0AAE3M955_9BACT|nr:C-GCAxxG-C-C family protein [Plebeiobacterium sediminum]MCW3789524.1 C-GCAxxG-C-C family protein [Plebeiobacterium sediminum]